MSVFTSQTQFLLLLLHSIVLYTKRANCHGEEKYPKLVHVWRFPRGLISISTEISSFLQ